ncbi:hypothetical protein FIBSPDRAFT_1055413 [Athelia psychrophila]|uniref:DUF7402 domain-containing protein n=1 Tax=Athelia psychrophila TaxID=1759441 RepID=A0A167TRY7_9AGAM|nr:hypothetical protein FIBSPDRAFT_1055413 [Fibularhizoctonia sp. CBS 109695]
MAARRSYNGVTGKASTNIAYPTIIQSPGGLNNFAATAIAVVSSSGLYNGVQTSAQDTIDGTMAPWVSQGGPGTWLLLSFPVALHMNMIYLYDRGNINDQIASGLLTFSDGSVITVGALNNDGNATPIIFPTVLASTILFEVTGVSSTTTATGLGEIQVFFNSTRLNPVVSSYAATASDGATDILAIGTINTALFGSQVPLPTGPITVTSSILSSTSGSSAAPSSTGTTQPSTPKKSVPLGAIVGGAVAGVVALLVLGFLLRMWCRRTPKTSSPQAIDPETRETGAYQSRLVYTPYEAPTGSPAAGGQLLYFDRDAKQNLSRQPLLPLPNSRTVAGSSTSGGTRYAESTSEGSESAGGSSARVPRLQVYPQDSKVLTAGPGARGAPPQYLP